MLHWRYTISRVLHPGAVITRSIVTSIFKTPHSMPARTAYGVFFVITNSDFGVAWVSAVLYEKLYMAMI